MLSSAQKHRLASALAHVLHAEERAEYVRAAIERGDLFAAGEDCRLLMDALGDAKSLLTRLDQEINPETSQTCERCGTAIAHGPYCRACQRDFADYVIEKEWTWTGPRE